MEGLHLEFAQIRTDEDALSFASTYGGLGHYYVLVREGEDPHESQQLHAESIAFWHHHAGIVRFVRKVWELLERDDVDALRKLIDPLDERGAYIADRAFTEIGGPKTRPVKGLYIYLHSIVGDSKTGFGAPDRFDAVFVARYTIQEIMNLQIQRSIDVYIQPGQMGFYLVVSDLLGAVYWHLAKEITGYPTNARFCEHCHSLIFEARADAKYCSADCRQKAFQQRRRNANGA